MPEAALSPLRISALPPRGMIALRLDLSDAGLREALAGAAGLPVPDIRRAEVSGGRALLWMSPDEALLICEPSETPALVAALEAALEGASHLVADLSDARAAFRIEGEGARDLLAKGAPVDFSRAAFGAGDLRRTRLGQIAVAVRMVSDAPDAFELLCFRSVAGHVEAWLAQASRPGSLPGAL